MVQADGPAFRRREDLPKNVEFAKSNLALAQNIQVSRADPCDQARIGPTANILSATRLPQLGCEPHGDSNGCGPWFCVPALRLVCLFEDDDAAGPLTRNYASAHVGQALHLTIDECCQAISLTYGSEDEFRAARVLSDTYQGPTTVRHASTANLCQLASKSNQGLETKRKYSVIAERGRARPGESLQSGTRLMRLIQQGQSRDQSVEWQALGIK